MSTAGSEVAGSTSTATSEQHRQARETLGLSDKRENFSDLTFLSKFRTNPWDRASEQSTGEVKSLAVGPDRFGRHWEFSEPLS